MSNPAKRSIKCTRFFLYPAIGGRRANGLDRQSDEIHPHPDATIRLDYCESFFILSRWLHVDGARIAAKAVALPCPALIAITGIKLDSGRHRRAFRQPGAQRRRAQTLAATRFRARVVGSRAMNAACHHCNAAAIVRSAPVPRGASRLADRTLVAGSAGASV